MAVVLHEGKSIQRREHTVYTTLCGRSSGRVVDGMNIAERPEQVSCKLCIRKRADLDNAMANVVHVEIWRDGHRVHGITGSLDYVLHGIDEYERASNFEAAVAYRRNRFYELTKIRDLGRPQGDGRGH